MSSLPPWSATLFCFAPALSRLPFLLVCSKSQCLSVSLVRLLPVHRLSLYCHPVCLSLQSTCLSYFPFHLPIIHLKYTRTSLLFSLANLCCCPASRPVSPRQHVCLWGQPVLPVHLSVAFILPVWYSLPFTLFRLYLSACLSLLFHMHELPVVSTFLPSTQYPACQCFPYAFLSNPPSLPVPLGTHCSWASESKSIPPAPALRHPEFHFRYRNGISFFRHGTCSGIGISFHSGTGLNKCPTVRHSSY